ncbi:hypothetical protein Hanom_Chr16g01434791 [Helianthus anomalus]
MRGEKNASNFRLSSLIPTALGSEFNYTMVDCKQQKGGWECGYMVLQHMFDFVNLYQNQFPDEVSNIYLFINLLLNCFFFLNLQGLDVYKCKYIHSFIANVVIGFSHCL